MHEELSSGSAEPAEGRSQASLVDVPDHVLESIFAHLKGGRRRHQYSVCAVCRLWRHIGQRVFFDSPWDSVSMICHPTQLLQLGSSCPPEGEMAVLECDLVRANFTLVVSNQEAGSIQYCCNSFSGLFRPRCIDVRLPLEQQDGLRHCSAAVGSPSLSPESSYECISSSASSSSDLDVSVSTRPNWRALCRRWMPWFGTEGKQEQVELEKCPKSETENVKRRTQAPQVGPSSGRSLQLVSRSPVWSPELGCWILNFRGRVQMPSIKNFQLVEAKDSTESVLFQFGKLVQDVYIIDFNPMYLSAVQAFATGLTAFDRKLIL